MSEAGSRAQPPGVDRKAIYGWMAFDWAAQPFFTVVVTFVFGPYFVSQLAPDAATGQAWWGYSIALSGLLVAVLSPVLGAIADETGARKRWIAGFALLKIASLVLLWTAAPGSGLLLPAALIVLASVAAEFSIVFNDSMMPRLMAREEVGRWSNIAWGLGYLGGMIFLIVVVAFIAGSPETGRTLLGLEPILGLDPATGEGARATAPLAAIWYAIFILPMFLFTPDSLSGKSMGRAVRDGLSELRNTLGEIRRRPSLLRFLIARMIYQDGVNGLIALGGTFAAAMFSWSITEIGVFGIILNVVAIFGCLAASRLDGRLGAKRMVMISLACLFVASIGIVSTGPGFTLFGFIPLSIAESGGLFDTAAEKAYLLFGLLIGVAFGPVQASSRSFMAQSITPEEAGRYFGFYALSGRVTAFLAPAAVATVTALTGSARLGMATLGIFLLAGMLILAATPYPKPDAARAESG